MKTMLRRLGAVGLVLCLLCTPALALTTQELGTILRQEYAGEVPARVWEQTTVEGMLKALGDPFSHYYTAQEYAAFLEDLVPGTQTGSAATVRLEGGHIGWIDLKVFGADTYGQLKAGMEPIEAAADKWVVDLRRNGGGELKAAADAMSVFAGKGELVYLRNSEDKLFTARSENTKLTMEPAIVLVGKNTASAAELYAATLRDRQVGLIIGGRTYGKGVAQTAFDKDHATYGAAFADGSALLLSTDRVFSYGMVSNNVIGVIPHLMVDDEQAEGVARLLCASAPKGNTTGYLRLSLARWRWFVDLSEAAKDPGAFRALLEALPPQSGIYLGTGGPDGWARTTAAVVAEQYHVSGYAARVFPDASGSPYADAINALKTYGILKGDEAGRFTPSGTLTRASLCALLAQAMGYPKSEDAPAFADTPAGAWYTPYVTTLNAMGLVNGYDDGLFHPDDPIPHQQFMVLLSRIAAATNEKSRGAMTAGPTEEDLATGNYDAYDPWARTGAWMLDGAWHAPANQIDPRGTTTREEAAYDLWSMLSIMGLILN